MGFKPRQRDFAPGTPTECVVHRRSKTEGTEQLILDIMPVIPILEEVWSSRIVFKWKDRRIKVVSTEVLAIMKRLSGRNRDLLDLRELGFQDAEEGRNAADAQNENG